MAWMGGFLPVGTGKPLPPLEMAPMVLVINNLIATEFLYLSIDAEMNSVSFPEIRLPMDSSHVSESLFISTETAIWKDCRLKPTISPEITEMVSCMH